MDNDTIKGRKYKKCKDYQYRNPKTLRCKNKLIAKPNHEIIKNKVYKKCKDNQERNPETMRCKNKTKICHNIMLEYDGINSCYLDSLLVSLFSSNDNLIYELFFKNTLVNKRLEEVVLPIKKELLKIYKIVNNHSDEYYKCSNLRKLLENFKKKYNKLYPNNTIDQNNWLELQSEPVQTLEYLNMILNFSDTTITTLNNWGSNSKPTKKLLATKPITSRAQNNSIIFRINCDENKKTLNISDKIPSLISIAKFDKNNLWKPNNTKYKYKLEEIQINSAKLLFVHIDRLVYNSVINNIVKMETIIKPAKKLNLKDNSVKHLHSIILHSGAINHGHYTCLFRCKNKWYLYDDLNKNIKFMGSYTSIIKNTKLMSSCTDLIYI